MGKHVQWMALGLAALVLAGCTAEGNGNEGARTFVKFDLAVTKPTVPPSGVVPLRFLIENIYEAQSGRQTDFTFSLHDIWCGGDKSNATRCANGTGGNYINSFGTGYMAQGKVLNFTGGYSASNAEGPHSVVMKATGCVFNGGSGTCSIGTNLKDQSGYDVAQPALMATGR